MSQARGRNLGILGLVAAILCPVTGCLDFEGSDPADGVVDSRSDLLDVGDVADTAQDLPDPPDTRDVPGVETSDTLTDPGPPDVADAADAADPSDTGPDATEVVAPAFDPCAPLPPAVGQTVILTPADDVAQAVATATPGTTLLLADGTYDASTDRLVFEASNVTLRSQSGNPDAVILDAGIQPNDFGETILIQASNVTIADLTIVRAAHHAVHVVGGQSSDINGTKLYNLRLRDAAEQAIKSNASGPGYYADGGEIACTTIEVTQAHRQWMDQNYCSAGGIWLAGNRDWVIRDNTITGNWCFDGLAQPAISARGGARDTVVERNLVVNNARGIILGQNLTESREYNDNPCGGNFDHYYGTARNNVVLGLDDAMFDSNSGVDSGIAMSYACDPVVLHNTVAMTEAPFWAIEARWTGTHVVVVNNLTTHPLGLRDGATATEVSNIHDAGIHWFVDIASRDAHLNAIGAMQARDKGSAEYAGLAVSDFDAQPRDVAPDIGADEVVD